MKALQSISTGDYYAESTTGVAVRQGGQPRGGYIDRGFYEDFNNGKITLAATSFLRYHHPRIKPYPPRGHLTLQIEEQQLPPLVDMLIKGQQPNPDLE